MGTVTMSKPDVAPSNLESWDDASLLQAIARQDQCAFAELYQRYKLTAYSVAYHVTADSSLAEEIVQESMLKVWQTAASYRADGPVRAWLMRIVAHRSLNLLKRKRHSERKPEEREMLRKKNNQAGENVEERVERDELLSTVRRLTGELPALERQLLALYYGGGLTQSEISSALSIPQQTVSYRIEGVLERLRATLSKSGFAAIPLVNDEILNSALCGGHDAPGELYGRIMNRISRIGADKLSPPATPASKSALALGAIVVSVVGGMIALGVYSQPREVLPDTHSPIAAKSEPPSAEKIIIPPQPAEKFYHKWTFNSGPPEDVRPIGGATWKYIPNGGSDRSGCMELGNGKFEAILKIPVPALPIKVSFRSIPKAMAMVGVGWDPVRKGAIFLNAGPKSITVKAGEWVKTDVFITAATVDRWHGNQRLALETIVPADGAQLLLWANAPQRIDDLEITSITAAEVPDVSKYLAYIDGIEPARRVGRVILPHAPSANKSEPLIIDFFSDPGALKRD